MFLTLISHTVQPHITCFRVSPKDKFEILFNNVMTADSEVFLRIISFHT